MDSICAKHRSSILIDIKKADAEAELETEALEAALFLLNGTAGNNTADARMFLSLVDTDRDDRLTATELWRHIAQLFFDLAFEDALGHASPENWLKMIKNFEIDGTQDTKTAFSIAELFPEQNSTIGLKEIN